MFGLSLIAFSALAANVLAQPPPSAPLATFANTSWTSVHIGQVWPIQWTPGNGSLVSLFLVNATWIGEIFVNRPAVPSWYQWTVGGPPGFSPGNYSLGLSQNGDVVYSSRFEIVPPSEVVTTTQTTFPTITSTVNATLISIIADSTVTVTYWDKSCSCKKKTVLPAATGSNVPGAKYTWYDSTCGCTRSAVLPAPTLTTSCYNWTAPPVPSKTWTDLTSAAPTPAPTAKFTGGAPRLVVSSGIGMFAAVAMAMLL